MMTLLFQLYFSLVAALSSSMFLVLHKPGTIPGGVVVMQNVLGCMILFLFVPIVTYITISATVDFLKGNPSCNITAKK